MNDLENQYKSSLSDFKELSIRHIFINMSRLYYADYALYISLTADQSDPFWLPETDSKWIDIKECLSVYEFPDE